MASTKQTGKPAHNQRLLAPQLFVGPPSRNASSTSLLPPHGAAPQAAARVPLTRQHSYLRHEARNGAVDGPTSESPSGAGAGAAGSTATGPSREAMLPTTPFGRRQPATQAHGMGVDQKSQARTEALWTEMQNTLKEVELNAAGGSHVFSEGHARALDELRSAQIALAQAWARSEADEDATRGEEGDAIRQNYAEKAARNKAAASVASERSAKSGGGGVGGGGGEGKQRRGSDASVKSASSLLDKSALEQETENDIAMAARRREANDRYFKRVNAGVVDVVAKLEEVARAMKGVEMESREVWGDDDGSVGTASALG